MFIELKRRKNSKNKTSDPFLAWFFLLHFFASLFLISAYYAAGNPDVPIKFLILLVAAFFILILSQMINGRVRWKPILLHMLLPILFILATDFPIGKKKDNLLNGLPGLCYEGSCENFE